jgi:hypothetical protein
MAHSIRVVLNIPKIMTRANRLWDRNLYALCSAIRADANEYVPVDQGTLRQSGYSASRLANGEIIWNTPYAKRRYYTGHPRRIINPNASILWCEKAKKLHRKQWNATVTRILRSQRLTD